MLSCVESLRRCGGGAAIPHSSVRYQEGTAIEAEETQRQLDRDSDFTETPVISMYLEELRLLCCALSVSMCVGGEVGWAGADVRRPVVPISI